MIINKLKIKRGLERASMYSILVSNGFKVWEETTDAERYHKKDYWVCFEMNGEE